MSRIFSSIALVLPLTLVGCGAVQQAAHDMAAEEIAADLIGRSVWTGNTTWKFAGLEEFESMRIVSVNGDDTETRFVVEMDLVDMYSSQKYQMRATVEYWHYGGTDGDWMLGSVNVMSFTSRY